MGFFMRNQVVLFGVEDGWYGKRGKRVKSDLVSKIERVWEEESKYMKIKKG